MSFLTNGKEAMTMSAGMKTSKDGRAMRYEPTFNLRFGENNPVAAFEGRLDMQADKYSLDVSLKHITARPILISGG